MKTFAKTLISIFALLILSTILIISVNKSQSSIFKKIGGYANNVLPSSVSSTLQMIFNNKINQLRIKNDYNVKFLPETQFKKINFKKIKLDFLKESEIGYNKNIYVKKFFIELDNDKIFFLGQDASLFYSKLKDIKKKENKFINIPLKFKQPYNSKRVLDFQIHNGSILISKETTIENCHFLTLSIGELDYQKLSLQEVYRSNECVKDVQAGKIEILNDGNILLTTAGDILIDKSESDPKAQDDNSIFGKVLILDGKTFQHKIFTKGHRNSLGLLVDGKNIISTENGPKGGDEINLEIEGKNYGWDLASYGSKYGKADPNLRNEMYGDHEELNFQEPIFSFVPSIGITEIIKLGNNFDKSWKNSYLIGSLNSKHLFRVNFDKDLSKVLFFEKIFIGERIRDLAYSEENKIILLALENSGSLGLLETEN